MDVFWQRLDQWLRIAMPSFVAFLMALLSAVSWPIPYLGWVMPSLAFMALYYWSSHRPDLFPPAAAFILGLLVDILHGFPLGLSALLFTIAHQTFWRMRRYFAGHSFTLFWSGFAIASLVLMLVQWFLTGLFSPQWAPIFPILVQTALSILLFPIPCWVLHTLQRLVLSAG